VGTGGNEMRTDDLLRSPKKRAVLLYIYNYSVFNTIENNSYAYEHAPEPIRARIGDELFAELLLQLVLDGFVDQHTKVVPKSETMTFIVEFKTTVKGNKWIHSRVIDPLSRDPQPKIEELIQHLLSSQSG
jgi:hypothetical protein